jgi:hypothetical protein
VLCVCVWCCVLPCDVACAVCLCVCVLPCCCVLLCDVACAVRCCVLLCYRPDYLKASVQSEAPGAAIIPPPQRGGSAHNGASDLVNCR